MPPARLYGLILLAPVVGWRRGQASLCACEASWQTIRAIAALVGKPAKTPGIQALHPDGGVITVIAEGNTKHEGSASHARYSLLRSRMTVAEYVAAAGPRGRRTPARRSPPGRCESIRRREF